MNALFKQFSPIVIAVLALILGGCGAVPVVDISPQYGSDGGRDTGGLTLGGMKKSRTIRDQGMEASRVNGATMQNQRGTVENDIDVGRTEDGDTGYFYFRGNYKADVIYGP
jgi:hypothetical protein